MNRWWVREIDENLRNKLPHFDSEDWQWRPHTHAHSITQLLKYLLQTVVISFVFFFTCRTFWFSAQTDRHHQLKWRFAYLLWRLRFQIFLYFCANGTNTHSPKFWLLLLLFFISNILWIKNISRKMKAKKTPKFKYDLDALEIYSSIIFDGRTSEMWNTMCSFSSNRTLNCFLEYVYVLECVYLWSLCKWLRFFLMHYNAISFLFSSIYLHPKWQR